jgi:hypothetical protein
MSSPGLPALTLDIAARRGERLVVLAVVVLAASAIFVTDAPVIVRSTLAALLAVALAAQFAAMGWLSGPRRIARIVCQQSGHWVLYQANGREIHAELSVASRISKQALWLCWSGRGWRPLLLFARDVSSHDYRRLLVRLRLAPFPHREEAHDA